MNDDWIEVELGDILFTTSGGTPKRTNPEYYKGNIPWVKSGELNYNTIRNTEEHISEEAINNSSAKLFHRGTLLIALYGATIGKLAILGITAATNQAVCGIYENEKVETRFIYYYLFHKRQDLINQGIGGAQPNISQTILKKLSVPICPLPEQRAIVVKIEELFSELDNGVASLNKAREQLEIYRQAVLRKAFNGELTKEWRKANSIGDMDNTISSSKSFNELCYANWKYESLSEVSDAIGGYAFKSSDFRKDNGEFQVIRIGNIRPGKLRINESPVYINNVDKSIISKYELKFKDVIITLTGTRKKRDYGYTTIVNKARLLLNQRIAALRFNEKCLPEFFLYYSWTDIFKNQFFESETGNVGQGNVGMNAIRKSLIPLPTIEEQVQIVSQVDEKLSVCDDIEKNLNKSLIICDTLRQSILKKAFEGKLLTENEIVACKKDTDWEPVEILLEKIKNELRSVK